ncbi:RsfA family transcriptional regulator [Tepidibacillus fermentans]|uniref:Prespore-specific regulator n=1 Tax=Tepidibacillus fermentans TaxID=1281767 RepID=A0A4V6NZ11_9BACI|nr:RsfA family transcriptional regulator [Tepidibacillus fermentans]TCS84429.1 prespore-specific regulator [Tepidibacillus fermentans]
MVATRQDAWTEDEDLLLAEVILRHIREGSTQLKAFEEIGQKLNRTPAACGFRWNSLIRKKYEAAIQIAKAQRQKRKNYQPIKETVDLEMSEEFTQETSAKQEIDSELSYDSVIRFLRKQKLFVQDVGKKYRTLEKDLEEKNRELEQLKQENKELKEKVKYLESDYQVVNEDYKALIQIIDRARKMAFLPQDDGSKPVFKMDFNGNLERID